MHMQPARSCDVFALKGGVAPDERAKCTPAANESLQTNHRRLMKVPIFVNNNIFADYKIQMYLPVREN